MILFAVFWLDNFGKVYDIFFFYNVSIVRHIQGYNDTTIYRKIHLIIRCLRCGIIVSDLSFEAVQPFFLSFLFFLQENCPIRNTFGFMKMILIATNDLVKLLVICYNKVSLLSIIYFIGKKK